MRQSAANLSLTPQCSRADAFARNVQALTTLPQTLSADAELARELCLRHVVLMIQHEFDEVALETRVGVGFIGRRRGRLGLRQLYREQCGLDDAAIAQDHRPLECVLELAHVAWPVISRDRIERRVGQCELGLRQLVADPAQ